MAYTSTQAIVLRRADYRESDRVLTLLTPGRGRVEVLARGCRKAKSPLLAACELFTLGEYVLYKGKGHETLTACTITDSFYAIRTDYERLSLAAIMLAAAEVVAQPEQEQQHLMILLLRSLTRLAEGTHQPEAVLAAYLLHFAALQGVKPRLNHCVACETPFAPGEQAWLDAAAGGLMCRRCQREHAAGTHLDAATVQWLRDVLSAGIEKTETTLQRYPVLQLKRYVEFALDRRLPRLPEFTVGL